MDAPSRDWSAVALIVCIAIFALLLTWHSIRGAVGMDPHPDVPCFEHDAYGNEICGPTHTEGTGP